MFASWFCDTAGSAPARGVGVSFAAARSLAISLAPLRPAPLGSAQLRTVAVALASLMVVRRFGVPLRILPSGGRLAGTLENLAERRAPAVERALRLLSDRRHGPGPGKREQKKESGGGRDARGWCRIFHHWSSLLVSWYRKNSIGHPRTYRKWRPHTSGRRAGAPPYNGHGK